QVCIWWDNASSTSFSITQFRRYPKCSLVTKRHFVETFKKSWDQTTFVSILERKWLVSVLVCSVLVKFPVSFVYFFIATVKKASVFQITCVVKINCCSFCWFNTFSFNDNIL